MSFNCLFSSLEKNSLHPYALLTRLMLENRRERDTREGVKAEN